MAFWVSALKMKTPGLSMIQTSLTLLKGFRHTSGIQVIPNPDPRFFGRLECTGYLSSFLNPDKPPCVVVRDPSTLHFFILKL